MKSRLQKTEAFSLLPKYSIHNTDYLRSSHCSPAYINILPRHNVHKQNYSLVIRATSSKFRPSPEATSTTENEAVTIKAVVKVQVTAGGFISTIGLTRPLDDFTDLVGKTLLLELVSTQLEPKTGLEKETIKGYANKLSQKDDEVIYESSFSIPAGFGEVGAVEVENEHHKEIFIKSIHLHGFPNGSVNVPCNSWTHSKFDNPQKRIFFTNKSYIPSETPSGLKRIREMELENLRGNGEGERKPFNRIYDYDTYNDLGDPDSNNELARPVLGSKQHPYVEKKI